MTKGLTILGFAIALAAGSVAGIGMALDTTDASACGPDCDDCDKDKKQDEGDGFLACGSDKDKKDRKQDQEGDGYLACGCDKDKKDKKQDSDEGDGFLA